MHQEVMGSSAAQRHYSVISAPSAPLASPPKAEVPAPAPFPALMGPPAPPSEAPGPSLDSLSPGPSVADDESGAETIKSVRKKMAAGMAVLLVLALVF